jgi:hypothetical protein
MREGRAAAVQQIREGIAAFRRQNGERLDQVLAEAEAATVPVPAPAAPAPPAALDGAAAALPRRRGEGAHLRLVKALAERHPKGFARAEIATLAGLNPRGGTFAKYLSTAKTAGLVEGDGGLWRASASGLSLARELPAQAPSAQHLVALWRGAIGGGGVRRMLDALIEAYPQAMDRTNLADRCGMTIRGGTFPKYLSILRTNGLAVVVGRRVRAAAILFEDANQGGSDGERNHDVHRPPGGPHERGAAVLRGVRHLD